MAHREGRYGEIEINQLIGERLEACGLVWRRPGHFRGEAVLVTRNNYRQNLFNGDVGVVVQPHDTEGLAVLFEDSASEDGLRRVPLSLVGDMKSCFAITIHKSQGSEFHRVMLVLPPWHSPLLTRELLYTAVTRVHDQLDAATGDRKSGKLYLLANENVLRHTIAQRIRRTSGMRDAIAARPCESD